MAENKVSQARAQSQQVVPSPSGNQHPYGMIQGITSSCPGPNFVTSSDVELVKDINPGAYDLGELDQALFFYPEGSRGLEEVKQCSGIRRPMLNIFPSRPMHFEASPKTPSQATSVSAETFDCDSALRTISYKREPQHFEFESPAIEKSEPTEVSNMAINMNSRSTDKFNDLEKDVKPVDIKRAFRGPTSSSEQEGTKTPDPKTLRRLAQNREAARKSRLRKKAYVQQLESSRIRLNQLEQELQRVRAQGILVGGGGFINDQNHPCANAALNGSLTSDAAMFDMEYARWLEEHQRHMSDLRAALQEHLPDSDLRLFVDNCLLHYDDILNIKSAAAKADVFHLVSGMWKTPAERCFMWMGGFRPSELLKILIPHIEPLTEQQFLGICSLQQSSQQAEEALSQGMEALQQSLSDTIASGSLSAPANMANYMGQMAIAMSKLANLEGFVRQADNLRHQTLQQIHRILSTRQAARCFLAIGEYFNRLRALSSLWSARPRE